MTYQSFDELAILATLSGHFAFEFGVEADKDDAASNLSVERKILRRCEQCEEEEEEEAAAAEVEGGGERESEERET